MDQSEIDRILASAPPEALHALDAAVRRGLSVVETPPPMRLSQWAERHFYLSGESSYTEGRWVCYPFQRAIMDVISHDQVEKVTLRKSARVGYTKIILAAMGYFAEHKRRNQVIYQPTDDDRDEFVTTELEPMLRDVRVMRRAFPKFNRKSKDNTLKQKKFLGCVLHTRGGKAAKNYRRLTVDVVYYDELDGFDGDVEKEGSPTKLGDKRIEGATFPKSIAGTTPKLKGFSLIETREAAADARYRYHIRCLHCGDEHPLQWGGKDAAHGMKWVDGDPDTVGHVCPHCAAWITQADYLANWRGRWIAEDGTWIDETPAGEILFRAPDGTIVPPPRHVALHIWTAYSPQATWADIVREFLTAQAKAKAGDTSDLKTFVNTTLGETWEEEVEKTEANALERRAEDYPLRHIPQGACKVVAGVDVQHDRWEVTAWAIGRGEEMWAVDYAVIYGNPADQREWDDKLDPYLLQPMTHACGADLSIEAAAIDTGGHFTHQAYVYVRNRPHRKLFAIKGESRPGQPIKARSSLQDVNERGRVARKGVRLWMVGTDTAKDLLHGRLQVTQPGPGYIHFSRQLPREFFEQLTNESRVLARTARGQEYRWIRRPGARVEVLDGTVYSLFCVQALELHKYSDRMWQRLELALQPDLFAMPGTPPAADAEPSDNPDHPRPAPAPTRPRQTALPPAPAHTPIASESWSSRI